MSVAHEERVFTDADLATLPRLHGEARREVVDGRLVIHAEGTGFTHDDLVAMPAIEGSKHELLDGAIVVSPPGPSNRHEGVLGNLYLLLRAAAGPDHRVRLSVFDVHLGTATIQPDLVVARSESITETGIEGAPVLVVEILSPSTRTNDLGAKRRLLQRSGCPSYWIVDPGKGPAGPVLTVLELVDGRYVEVARVSGTESWTSTRPFEVTVVPDELLDD